MPRYERDRQRLYTPQEAETDPELLAAVQKKIAFQLQLSDFFERNFSSATSLQKISFAVADEGVNAKKVEALFTREMKSTLKSIGFLRVIAHGFELQQHFSFTMLYTLLRAMQSPDVQAWLSAGRKRADTFNQVGYQSLIRIIDDKEFATFAAVVSLQQYTDLLKGYWNNGLYDVGYQRVADSMTNLLANPRLVVPLAELLHRYPKWRHADWDERLKVLGELQEVLGVPGPIDDDQLSQVIFQIWRPQTEADQELKKNFSTLPVSDQQALLSRLRNGTPVETTTQIRRIIIQQRSLAEHDRLQAESERLAATIRLVEHPLHPWAKVIPSFGFEIETDDPRDAVGAILRTFDAFGHHMGGGGSGALLEMSPGPFHSAITAKAIFESWVNSEWLNLHRARMQTCHMNVALRGNQTVSDLNHLVASSGYAYHPVWKEHERKWYELRLVNQRSTVNGESYIETKGFSVVNKPDFLTHLDQYSLLAAAAGAYEQFHQNNPDSSATSYALLNHGLQQYAEKCGYSPYVFDLALVWKETMDAYRKVAAHFGLLSKYGENLGPVPNEAMLAQFDLIFPQPSDHFDAQERLRISCQPQTDTKRSQYISHYDNLFAATRPITSHATERVATILAEMQRDFYEQLLAYNKGNNSKRRLLQRAFYQRFPYYRERATGLDELGRELLPLFRPFGGPKSTLPSPI